MDLEKLELSGLNVDRIRLYQDTFDKEYNEKILYLRYKDLSRWMPRDNIINNIKKRYNNNISEPRVIQLSNEKPNTLIYNLTQICREKNVKVLYELYLKFPEIFNINDHMIFFNIIIGHKNIIRITNLGSKIFCTSQRNIIRNKRDGWIYYPIYLFECMEKGFLDILDTEGRDIYLVVEYMKRNDVVEDLDLNEMQLYCFGIDYFNTEDVERNYMEYCLIERNSFYSRNKNDEWIKVISKHKESSQMPGKYNTESGGGGATVSTKEKWLCPVMYTSFLWDTNDNNTKEQPWPNIEKMDIDIDDWYRIEYASSRIITDNTNNFHSIWFFPDTDDDLIKQERVFGINLSAVNEIDIKVEFSDAVNVNETKSCIGIMSFNILVWYNGDCKNVYR